MITQTYNVEGMVCAACSSAVEKVTRKLDGVKSSNVNLTTKQLSIEYDEAICTMEQICSVVQKAGFEISLKTEKNTETKTSTQNNSKKEKVFSVKSDYGKIVPQTEEKINISINALIYCVLIISLSFLIQGFLGDFVLGDYGTGAVMAVPSHDQRDFEYAIEHNLEMIQVIDGRETDSSAFEKQDYLGKGCKLINSEEFTGLTVEEAMQLQGYDPAKFRFPVSKTQAYKQIGNSVVWPAIHSCAREIAKVLKNRRKSK